MSRFMRDPATKNAPARSALLPPEQNGERREIVTFINKQSPPRPSDEQGVGKTPGFDWPWQRTFQSLVPPRARMRANWPNHRTSVPRPERTGWGTQYLLFYEQQARHVWPGGGVGAPQHVIEHPETVPLTALAPRL